MTFPVLSEEDRQAALEKAAQARVARAQLRKRIKTGEVSVKEILESTDDPIVERLRVSTLIESLPGYGKAKSEKIMMELDISPSRRVKGLGIRQRDALLERFAS